jgi:ankyrin repeat protein
MFSQQPTVPNHNYEGKPLIPHTLAARGDHTQLRALLTISKTWPKAVDLDLKNRKGSTPLSLAAERGHLPVVKLLCRQQDIKVDINAVDEFGRTPLFLAAKNGYAEIVEYLLRQETLSKYQDAWCGGGSPISWAVISGHEGVVRVLLEYKQASVNSRHELPLDSPTNRDSTYTYTYAWRRRDSESSLLSLACLHNHASIVSYLLTRPDFCVSQSDLEDAARVDRADILRLLLEHHRRTALEFRRDFLCDLLPYAAEFGSSNVVQCLVTEYDVPVDTLDHYTRTALQRAVRGGFEECVRALVGLGADVEQQDDDGRSLLDLAGEGGSGWC